MTIPFANLFNRPFAFRKVIEVVCISLLMNCLVIAQSTNARLSGTITDPTGAAIPGALIRAQNVKTGVTLKATSNDSGVYQFASLQPGVYQISAEKSGFQKLAYNDVELAVSAQVSLNFQLQVGQVTGTVEVEAGDRTDLGEISTSAGGVVTGEMIRELPLPDRDAIDLVTTQAGVFNDNLNGSREGAVFITRDGINIQDNRQNVGLNSPIFNSVDLIQEVRVVTSPADAEYGRGSGQIQLITRSGGNEFHGSVFEQYRSKALNANTWFDNLNGRPNESPTHNQFGARLGGPIRRNKTFFHIVYEGQRQRDKDTVNSTVLTGPARQGIFRFFPGVPNANANASVPTVDLNGNPVRPPTATGPLQSVSLFNRDPNRRAMDTTGVIAQYLRITPLPNNFRFGDGLNTAGFTWTRTDTSDFDNITVKIDHHFNESHRLSYTYTRDNAERLNGFLAQRFPDAPGGFIIFKNRMHSLSLTSTLSSNLVNELRVGAFRPSDRRYGSIEAEGASDLLPTIGGQQFALNVEGLGLGLTNAFNIGDAPHGRINPVYQLTDHITWLKGRHSFKGGVDIRFVSSNGFNSIDVFPRANIGTGGAAIQGINNTAIPGLGSNTTNAQRVLNLLSGSLSSVVQAFNSNGGSNPRFVPGEVKQRTWTQREVAFFFKDDFKVRPNLTLNLGLRYEFYGVPFDANGRTTALVGGGGAIFGISGNSFAAMYRPGINSGSLTQIQQVGKNSPNPREKLYNNDWNNFAPAVGLSWSMPWFGKDKTVLRVGYGVGYERNALRLTDVVSGDQPGLRTTSTFSRSSYLDLTGVRLPLIPAGGPLEPVPLTERTQTVRGFDENLRTPYYQNWNVAIQRSLGWKTLLEIRYVGNKGSKLPRSTNVNEANIFETGILDAFLITQSGGNSLLLDRIFTGLNIPGLGTVGTNRPDGTRITGSDAARFISTTRDHLANNSVGSFAMWLATTNSFTNQIGGLIRRAGLPENFIIVNPQFANANLLSNFANSTYHAMQIEVTKRFSNGLQFRSNYSWSRTLGEEDGNGQELLDNYRDGRNRRMDKRLLSFHRTHIWKNSGTFELPFGPKKMFLSGNNPILSRLVSRWQIGFIYQYFSGRPLTIRSGRNSINQFGDDNTPDAVGPFPRNIGRVVVTGNGIFYFSGLGQIRDPSANNMSPQISPESDLRAIVDASGRLLLVNPGPGRLGNLGLTSIEGPGGFRFDVNLVKRIRIHESRNLELRVDVRNVLNHPIWGDPNTDINSSNFGRITSAGGNRSVVLTGRFNF